MPPTRAIDFGFRRLSHRANRCVWRLKAGEMASVQSFDIRPGRLDDVEAIAEHNVTMAMETENLALDREVVLKGVKAHLDDPTLGGYYLAFREGELAGQLFVNKEWVPHKNGFAYWIQSVYVRPQHRRNGCFRSLYRFVRMIALEQGGVALKLYADEGNTRARATYESLGMAISGRVMQS